MYRPIPIIENFTCFILCFAYYIDHCNVWNENRENLNYCQTGQLSKASILRMSCKKSKKGHVGTGSLARLTNEILAEIVYI